jgi:Predicted protease
VYSLTNLQASGAGVIVIVDAYHYPTALNDFNVFASQFGLPREDSTDPLNANNQVFQVVYARKQAAQQLRLGAGSGARHRVGARDGAERQDRAGRSGQQQFRDLFQAVDVASASQRARSVDELGRRRIFLEASNDGHFTHPGIVYFAASGDTGGATIYPGVSPNVVAAGGTRINRNGAGAFVSETGWSGSGGGPSKYEPRPAYQDIIQTIVGGARGVPDYSFDADPNSGVSVYDSTSCKGASGWMVFGGTSVASPALSGIVNSAGSNTSSAAELSTSIRASATTG